MPARRPTAVRTAAGGRKANPKTDTSASKSELAYEAIRQRITNGTYGSGYRLVLDQLAQELSVSPVPVREAIRRLEAEGYVIFRRHVGAQVASLDGDEYDQVVQVMAVLEATATVLALPFLDDKDLAQARAVNDDLRKSFANFDPVTFTSLNAQFHRIFYAKCPNDHLREFIGKEWKRMDALQRPTFHFVGQGAKDSMDEHDRLIELIEANAEPSDIEWFCRNHRTATTDREQFWRQLLIPRP